MISLLYDNNEIARKVQFRYGLSSANSIGWLSPEEIIVTFYHVIHVHGKEYTGLSQINDREKKYAKKEASPQKY